ncbi:MAG: (Fe-S)-binding protein [Bacteroidota bacterium]
MTKRVFAPGCALMLYKPELAAKLHDILDKNLGPVEKMMDCCHHDPLVATETEVINVCPGCDKRFGKDYPKTSTISLWEILAEQDFFPFPDHHGRQMTILDACPTRNNEKVHAAIRILLEKMNISLVEPRNTRTKGTCCGDSFYGVIPTEKVKEQMIKRSSEMPLEDVVVYCVSCIKSIHIGGKHPQYLVDLLFADETLPKTFEPDDWHRELAEYMEQH